MEKNLKKILIASLFFTIHLYAEKITFMTSDGNEYKIEKEIILASETIKHLLENVESFEDPIPLPLLTGDRFEHIIKCLEKPIECSEDLKKIDLEHLMQFIQDVLYLDISSLLYKSVKVLAPQLSLHNIPFTLSRIPQETITLLYALHPAREFFMEELTKNREQKIKYNNVTDIAVTADGRLFANSLRDETIKIWNLNNLGQGELQTVDEVPTTKIFVTPQHLITYAFPLPVEIWDINSLNQGSIASIDDIEGNIMVSPDGKYLVEIGLRKEHVKIWDLSHVHQPPQEMQHLLITDVSISPDSQYLVISTQDDDAPILIFELKNIAKGPIRIINYIWPQKTIMTSNFEYLISVSGSEDAILVWDLRSESNEPKHILEGVSAYRIVTSPNGKYLIHSHRGTVKVWNLENLVQGPAYTIEDTVANQIQVSPDNRYLVILTDANIKVWDFKNLDRAPQVIDNPNGQTLSISPDSQYIISSSERDNEIRVWQFSEDVISNPSSEGATILMGAFLAESENAKFDISYDENLKKAYDALPAYLKARLGPYIQS